MSMPKYDAWFLGRVQAHDDLAPERLDAVSERWKPMAASLAAKPLEDRIATFGTMLAALPTDEAESLEAAIDAVDSDGHPPPVESEPIIEAVASWGPLRINDAPRATPFPADVFPPPLATFCREVAESTLCPVGFVGTAMLVTGGASIGQSVNLLVKRGWTEAPSLYAVIVAPPGRAKTPAIRAASRPLTEIDNRLRNETTLAREQWEDRKKAHAKDDTEPPPGPEPPQRRAIVKDITRESLCIVLAENPRGVLCSPDEATAWVGSWNQYKSKGTDEQFWLSTYSGDPVTVDRKGGRESLYIPHPFCAVLGGIQPDLLASLTDDRGRDNGFLDRIVFSFPDAFPLRQWTDKVVSPEAERDWSEAIGRLFSVGMHMVDDHALPWLAEFTPKAKARFVAWFDENGRAMDAPESRSGALAKGEGRLARFALILSRLRLACDPFQALQDDDGVPPVTKEDVEGAIRLTTYFADHLERVAHRMTRGVGSADALALVEWMRRKQLAWFREAEAREDLRRFRDDPEAISAATRLLVTSGVIRLKPEAAIEGKPGRKPSPAYEVHPDLLRSDSLSGKSG
ncbi:MAG: DUF3987 domain-containing protein [Paludisphaera borealis]|uniref:DUF3987 domain-containing protein n=1 Tax=Paludisphaera borealis TaxID=1387353 RepID=UPI00284D76F2|nr:DUF3987 domain-containing protein [Paludisphaera borealis]MDR3618221.1 DUF3987 domain-containing protein [Paludisphaera borealis]